MNSRIVRTVGVLGALFNAVGIQAYLAHVGVLGANGATPPDAAMPFAITAAFAIAVFGGVIGGVGLALLTSWARPVLWMTFVASVVNWGWVFAYSEAASFPLGMTVIVVSLLLAIVAERARGAS